jgi:hypothetical protein
MGLLGSDPVKRLKSRVLGKFPRNQGTGLDKLPKFPFHGQSLLCASSQLNSSHDRSQEQESRDSDFHVEPGSRNQVKIHP